MARRKKGTGSILETPEGTFRALFPFTRGKAREEIDGSPFASRPEAERALDGVLAALRAGDVTRGGVTLRKLGGKCLDQREKAGYRAVHDDRNRWKCYVETSELIDLPAASITRGDVREWLAGVKKATQTKRNALNLLRAVFAYGVEREMLADNPCDGVKVKDHGTTLDTSTFLTKEEADALIAAATDPAVALAIGTGMRSGELRALRWEDVGSTHITVRFGKPGKVTKTVHGRRRVPLLPLADAALAELRARRGGVAKVGIVLPGVQGGHRGHGQVVRREDWKAWLKAAGITRRVRFHDLRHTTATLLLTGAWGEPWTYEEVKEMLGHSSVKVTERYAKATGTLADKAAANKIRMGSAPESAEVLQAREMLGRRGSDSNRRMTVLQAQGIPSDAASLDRLLILSRSFAEAVASRSPFAIARGLDLADVAWDLAEASRPEEVACG